MQSRLNIAGMTMDGFAGSLTQHARAVRVGFFGPAEESTTKMRNEMLRRALLTVIAIFMWKIALAFPNEPDGFKGAKFHMSLAQVKEIFPTLAPTGVQGGKRSLSFHRIDGEESLGELRPCKVKLRFAADELYQIDFDCGRDDRVVEYLKRQYGEPTNVVPNAIYWYGEKAIISLNPNAKTFGFIDRALNETVQQQLFQAVLKSRQATPAGSTSTPGPEKGRSEQQ
jgi:hypothetical protein